MGCCAIFQPDWSRCWKCSPETRLGQIARRHRRCDGLIPGGTVISYRRKIELQRARQQRLLGRLRTLFLRSTAWIFRLARRPAEKLVGRTHQLKARGSSDDPARLAVYALANANMAGQSVMLLLSAFQGLSTPAASGRSARYQYVPGIDAKRHSNQLILLIQGTVPSGSNKIILERGSIEGHFGKRQQPAALS